MSASCQMGCSLHVYKDAMIVQRLVDTEWSLQRTTKMKNDCGILLKSANDPTLQRQAHVH